MKITVKELIERLQNEDQDLEMYFGGLEFHRLKEVGNTLHLEFNQTVYKNEDGSIVIQNH